MNTYEHISEEALILRCQLGDEEAFHRVFERYNAPLRYFVQRLVGDADAADDVVQNTWLAVVRKVRTLRKQGAFRVWLYRIARNRAYAALKKRGATVELPDDCEAPPSEGDEEAFTADDAAAVHRALGRLSPAHREVLVLCFLEDLSYGQIAEVTHCALGTVKSRIHYAKHALRRAMEAMSDGREQGAG
jgi:RNA polymerase sigma-70 factor (ECF subfamily)